MDSDTQMDGTRGLLNSCMDKSAPLIQIAGAIPAYYQTFYGALYLKVIESPRPQNLSQNTPWKGL